MAAKPDAFHTVEVAFGREKYSVSVQPASTSSISPPPPLVMIPPVGVGIDRKFYDRLHAAWAALGAPAAMHSIDLLGTGSAFPKPRRFYSPEIWADQLDAYIREQVKEPCVLVVQGGLLPSALEVWRRAGPKAIAGITLLSPPPLKFFSKEAETETAPDGPKAAPPGGDAGFNPPARVPRVRKRDRLRGALLFWNRDQRSDFSGSWNQAGAPVAATPSRRTQRLVWAIACTPVGNLFFRRLRGGTPAGVRIREFTQRSLFANSSDVDDEWMANCIAGAADSRGRFSTFAYLAGSIPEGGAWRDDRTALFDEMDVPLQLLRGDFGGMENATERAEELLQRAPRPDRESSAIIKGARACLPYEKPVPTARMLARFVEASFGAGAPMALGDEEDCVVFGP